MYNLLDIVIYNGNKYEVCGINIDKQGIFNYSITPIGKDYFEIVVNGIYNDELRWSDD